jgi:enediyne biosynthesis protein E4
MRSPRLLAILLALLALGVLFWLCRPRPAMPSASPDLNRLAAELAALEAREQHVAETVWHPDLLAQHCARGIEELWDSLNRATNRFDVLAEFPFTTLQPGQREADASMPHGITLFKPAGDGPEWTPTDWRQWLGQMRDAGWQLGPLELRHNRFEPDPAGQPGHSVFHCAAQLLNPVQNARATIQGNLEVEWDPTPTPEGMPAIRRLDARALTLAIRSGPPAFTELFQATIAPPDRSFFIDPLILQDLDGDGLSEIILAASNTVFRRQPDGSYARASLCRHPPGLIFTAVMADFDGDGATDFLCARHDGLLLYRGTPDGTFLEPGQPVWAADPRLRYGQALTCGDVDGDGDLDVWLGQYKSPYERGQMPTPYYDANDGHPAWLLLNQGQGLFADATEAAGLAAKRHRRAYAGSLVDLNRDGHLDLLVISDFAGAELYLNDGHGRFTDVTDTWIPVRHGFGMAHTLADFNRDGRLDFLVTGMHCPTALRLDHLGLVRPGYEDYARFRAAMTAGNRLWIAQPGGGFQLSPQNGSAANSGWSWGCTSFDADNDGWLDLFVANGHESRQSVRDYEPEFWLHDIYVGNSQEDLLKTAYFGAKIGRTRGRGWSYGGYDLNRLYLNRSGAAFVEAGHLFGVALQQDCRAAVADDLDGDGRMDLLVTTFEVWPEIKQTLRVYRNQLEADGNWIGFRLRNRPGTAGPAGVSVQVSTSQGEPVRHVVTGDSHRAQHAATVHFGLGTAEEIRSVAIRWPNRPPQELASPAINRYHWIEPSP